MSPFRIYLRELPQPRIQECHLFTNNQTCLHFANQNYHAPSDFGVDKDLPRASVRSVQLYANEFDEQINEFEKQQRTSGLFNVIFMDVRQRFEFHFEEIFDDRSFPSEALTCPITPWSRQSRFD